ncbi:MAG: LysR family transcriptional regulator, partial [Candidatus Limosilactobacillus intestinavium]
MIETFLLEQLVAFAKYGTLSKAAQQLHISQPALSKSMQKLESEIGVPLFKRSKSHIELNDTGEVAVKYAKLALQANELVTFQTKKYSIAQHTLHIGVCNSIVLDPVINSLHKWLPSLQIKNQISNDQVLIQNLLNHQLDLAILHTNNDISGLTYKHFLDERLMLTLDRDDTLANHQKLHFKDLSGRSILAHKTANFWIEICQDHIPGVNLLIQEKLTSMKQLFEAAH